MCVSCLFSWLSTLLFCGCCCPSLSPHLPTRGDRISFVATLNEREGIGLLAQSGPSLQLQFEWSASQYNSCELHNTIGKHPKEGVSKGQKQTSQDDKVTSNAEFQNHHHCLLWTEHSFSRAKTAWQWIPLEHRLSVIGIQISSRKSGNGWTVSVHLMKLVSTSACIGTENITLSMQTDCQETQGAGNKRNVWAQSRLHCQNWCCQNDHFKQNQSTVLHVSGHHWSHSLSCTFVQQILFAQWEWVCLLHQPVISGVTMSVVHSLPCLTWMVMFWADAKQSVKHKKCPKTSFCGTRGAKVNCVEWG